MVLYANRESLIKRYTLKVLEQIAWLPETQTLDETKVQEALEDASQTIDSYLGGRYALPTRPVRTMKIRSDFWKRSPMVRFRSVYQTMMKR